MINKKIKKQPEYWLKFLYFLLSRTVFISVILLIFHVRSNHTVIRARFFLILFYSIYLGLSFWSIFRNFYMNLFFHLVLIYRGERISEIEKWLLCTFFHIVHWTLYFSLLKTNIRVIILCCKNSCLNYIFIGYFLISLQNY